MRARAFSVTIAWVFVSMCAAVFAQAPAPKAPAAMTNADVIKMVKVGLTEDLVTGAIRKAAKTAFDLSADGLVALKTAGVGDGVIRVMMDPAAAPAAPAAPAAAAKPAVVPAAVPAAAPAPPTAAESMPVAEIGVYYRDGDMWRDLMPEVVNWKTGGVFKHFASAGIIKGDVNGLVNGPGSKLVLKASSQIMVYTPEGTAITEYQLLKLRQSGNTREFRTVTGGVLHAEGGATRDLVPFESEKVASRTYKLILPTLTAGEYGILSPGAGQASSASSQLGKIYTFRIQ